jgi:hypothetical protein
MTWPIPTLGENGARTYARLRISQQVSCSIPIVAGLSQGWRRKNRQSLCRVLCFFRGCGPVGWGWELESALVSPYYVVKGTELSQCPSLESAIGAANEYRHGAVEDLNRIIRPSVPTSLVAAMTQTATAAVCVRIAENQVVPLDEFRQILAKDQRLLATLTAREQQIFRMHFGIGQATSHASEEISAQLGLPIEQLREGEIAAIRKLGSGTAGRRIQQFQKKVQKEIQKERQRLQDIARVIVNCCGSRPHDQAASRGAACFD